MAQTIKLKRSATTGKVPSTSNLALGELAVNTYDGRIFFKKNDGSDSIEHIVTTDSVTTGSITIIGTTQTTTLTTTNRIDKQYLDDEVLNTSLNSFTQSAITVTGNGTSDFIPVFSGTHTVINSKIETGDTSTTLRHSNNGNTIFTISGSNGELLTVTDSNSGNLLEVNDSSGIDVFTVAANGDVSASGAITASGVTGLTSLSVGGTTTTNNLTLSSLSNQASEATALMINGSNVVGTRELGDNAFNSTAFTTNTGTVTSVTINTAAGLDGGGTTITNSGTVNLSLDLSELTDMTGGVDSDETELILLDNGTESKKAIGEIALSQFSNDSGFLTNSSTQSKYLRSDTTDTATGVITFSNTTQSTSKTSGGVKISGGVGIAKTLNVGEDVVAYASSDERYKDNVTPIENPNEKLKQIGGYTFDWNDKHEVFKGQHDVGVIAQEIEKVLPEIVETRESGYKAVKYEKIVALLIESNKELIKRVEELESKLK